MQNNKDISFTYEFALCNMLVIIPCVCLHFKNLKPQQKAVFPTCPVD